MTEMTMPEVSGSRKPNQWKVIVAVVVIVIVCCIVFAVLGVLAYMGSQGNGPFAFIQDVLPAGQSVTGDWYLYYDWGCTGEYYGPAVITFNSDLTFALSEGGDTSYGQWRISSNTIEFIFNDYPNAYYTGTVDQGDSYIEGTMTNTDGGSGCWYADQ